METTVQSSSTISSMSNINGKVSSYKKSSCDLQHRDTESPRNNAEIGKVAEQDTNPEGKFHMLDYFRSKMGKKKPNGFTRKIQGNTEDGVRRDKLTVREGKKRKMLNLHNAFSAIKNHKEHDQFQHTNFHELGHMEVIDKLKSMFSLTSGGNENDTD